MNYSLTRKVQPPHRGTARSAGMDLFVPEFSDEYVNLLFRENRMLQKNPLSSAGFQNGIAIPPHARVKIPMGLRVEVPYGYVLWVANKGSGSWDVTLTKLAEIIDEDYQGEIFITLHNYSDFPLSITQGQKLIQVICVPVKIEDWSLIPDEEIHLTTSQRGAGAMGSTSVHP